MVADRPHPAYSGSTCPGRQVGDGKPLLVMHSRYRIAISARQDGHPHLVQGIRARANVSGAAPAVPMPLLGGSRGRAPWGAHLYKRGTPISAGRPRHRRRVDGRRLGTDDGFLSWRCGPAERGCSAAAGSEPRQPTRNSRFVDNVVVRQHYAVADAPTVRQLVSDAIGLHLRRTHSGCSVAVSTGLT